MSSAAFLEFFSAAAGAGIVATGFGGLADKLFGLGKPAIPEKPGSVFLFELRQFMVFDPLAIFRIFRDEFNGAGRVLAAAID